MPSSRDCKSSENMSRAAEPPPPILSLICLPSPLTTFGGVPPFPFLLGRVVYLRGCHAKQAVILQLLFIVIFSLLCTIFCCKILNPSVLLKVFS